MRPGLEKQISRIARRTRRPFSEVTQDLLEEALRMRQSPGIYFADEPGGRVAKVAGTGLAVWEVLRDYRAEGGTEVGLRRALPQLTPGQSKAAQLYYGRWREEIDDLIADNEEAADPTT
ncbi:MAG: hypothetical protein ACREM3_15950 [Candidatus Rokuibacteriota bacterium]